jgi:hypothetical protein
MMIELLRPILMRLTAMASKVKDDRWLSAPQEAYQRGHPWTDDDASNATQQYDTANDSGGDRQRVKPYRQEGTVDGHRPHRCAAGGDGQHDRAVSKEMWG